MLRNTIGILPALFLFIFVVGMTGCGSRTVTWGDFQYNNQNFDTQFGLLEVERPDGLKLRIEAWDSQARTAIAMADMAKSMAEMMANMASLARMQSMHGMATLPNDGPRWVLANPDAGEEVAP